MKKTVLALITARGDSKGIPKKNIRNLAGKPLIAWTIEMALKCQKLDRVIVSTDDSEIAKVCRSYGADVPFMRPNELARDNSPHMDAVIHAMNWIYNNDHYRPDYVMLLQPTSPLRETQDISAAIDLAILKNADSIVSVTETHSHPYIVREINEKGILVDFIEKPKGYLPRQVFPEVFHENGAIYLAKREVILKQRTWYTNCTYPFIMPTKRSIDIDTPWDLHVTELILRDRINQSENTKLSIIK